MNKLSQLERGDTTIIAVYVPEEGKLDDDYLQTVLNGYNKT